MLETLAQLVGAACACTPGADTLYCIALFPLFGFLLNGLFFRSMPRSLSGLIAVAALAMSFLWTCCCFYQLEQNDFRLHQQLGTWISVGGFDVSFGLVMDRLSGVMCLFITGIATLIHIYSIGYMSHDPGYARYFAYLNLFVFSMLVLVLGDSLLTLFVGWEGVGLCSYLLIGYWYEDGQKAAAGMKAFIFNRVGDLGFLLGIFVLFATFGTIDFYARPGLQADTNTPGQAGLLDYGAKLNALNRPAEEGAKALKLAEGLPLSGKYEAAGVDLSHTLAPKIMPLDWTLGTAICLACILLFIGACGKSAQLPLYAWLPDAMAGPTSVSALIHAATMVTAGVYMVVRMHSLFLLGGVALTVVAVVGACTALFAALIGLTQTDIKKVLAYSTVSQLGYMFLGAGVGAFWLALFHVVTHAFFKALLFLCSGSVIHAMSGEQDMTKMGNLRKYIPITFATMVVGALALAGFPLTAGWFSKDMILEHVLGAAHENGIFYLLYAMGIVGAFCTAFYTFRLIFLTFFGEERISEEAKHHLHESPASMTGPLIVLAILSAFGGIWLGAGFTGDKLKNFLDIPIAESIAHHAHDSHSMNLALTFIAAIGGIALATAIYIKGKKVPNPEKGNVLVRMSWHRFGVDYFYDKIVVGVFSFFAELIHLIVDVLIVDLLLVNGTAKLTSALGGSLRKLQSGLLNAYAVGILSGALVVLYLVLK